MSSVTSPESSRGGSPAPPPPRARATRAALRDYYGLKTSAATDTTPEPSPQLVPDDTSTNALSEFNTASFDGNAYVQEVLATKHLDEILRLESQLIGEIRSLDGEKKALVYDNYSKLITATDTIRHMRDNMAPLMPEDSSLVKDIAQITSTAEKLAARPPASPPQSVPGGREYAVTPSTRKANIETVKWVLDTPRRLESLIDHGELLKAKRDWSEIQGLLDKWQGVDGVERIEQTCQKLMERHES